MVLQHIWGTTIQDMENQSESSAIYCVSCGRQVNVAWRFCAHCGGEVPEDAHPGLSTHTRVGPGVSDVRSVLWNSAVSRMRQSQLDTAEATLAELLTKFPDHAESHALMAVIDMKHYRIEEARERLDHAVELAPESAFVRLTLAQYWLALGIAPRAFDELAKAEAAAADDLPLYKDIRALRERLIDKSRWNFVRQTGPPQVGGWFSRFIR